MDEVLTLGRKQRWFVKNLGLLIAHVYASGYELTLAEAYRTPEQAALNAKKGSGISNSLHTQRLAIDLNLFFQGKFLQDSQDHRPFGEYWKSLHSMNRWGGDFSKPDGNHYSMTHGGVS